LSNDLTMCIDTDALVNLLALESLDDSFACIPCDCASCFCLPAAAAQIKRSKWVGDRWPRADRDRMAEKASRLASIPPPKNITMQDALNSIPDIEEGDAYLLTYMVENPRPLLVTADSRMLRAVHSARDGAARRVQEEIFGRVLVFPQIVGALARSISVSEMEDRWRLAAPWNHAQRQKSLSVMFGSPPTREDDFWRGYELQVSLTTDVCGAGLLYPL
jgi:hypothetical protein